MAQAAAAPPVTGQRIIALAGRSVSSDIDSALSQVAGGPGLRLGASSPFSAIEGIGRAAARAHVARAATGPQAPYVRYNRDLLPVLLASTPAAAETLANETLAPVLALPAAGARGAAAAQRLSAAASASTAPAAAVGARLA